MRTVTTADEHHAETRAACDGRELRFTILALRRVRRNCRAAVRTIEGFSLHLHRATSAATAYHSADCGEWKSAGRVRIYRAMLNLSLTKSGYELTK